MEAARAMRGKAKSVTSHVPVGAPAAPGQQVAPVAELLNAYEAVFVPAAATDAARSRLRHVRQGEDEEILEWKTRLLYHYRRAYPHMTPVDVAQSGDLKDLFMRGLKNAETRKGAIWSRPTSIQDAYEAAMIVEGNLDIYDPLPQVKRELNSMQPGTSGTDSSDVSSMQPGTSSGYKRTSFGGKCWRCDRFGHISRFCPAPQPAARGRFAPYTSRGRRGGSRGGASFNSIGQPSPARGRGRGRPTRGQRGRPREPASRAINAIQAEDQDPMDDYSQGYGDLEDYEGEDQQDFPQA